MKLVLVLKSQYQKDKDYSDTWHVNQIRDAARKTGMEVEVKDFKDLEDAVSSFKNSNFDVVYWKNSNLQGDLKKNIVLNLIGSKKYFNPANIKFPYLKYKLFQYILVERFLNIDSILTFTANTRKELEDLIKSGELTFPFILKKNYGSCGRSVTLIKSKRDLSGLDINYADFIFQEFIPNDGDYRVFMLGRKMIGAIKRKAAPGKVVNNISQGGSAEQVTDERLLKQLEQRSKKIVNYFDLRITGIDYIFDAKRNKFVFLELNTGPEWKGFQKVTGIKVAEKIVQEMKKM
ncbi:MAG: hypothetical protein GF347_04540 [Candidatus Moranbacteria bacterium]|nr:hypothetical protein [Candidatus Moranbacteria bacterium]